MLWWSVENFFEFWNFFFSNHPYWSSNMLKNCQKTVKILISGLRSRRQQFFSKKLIFSRKMRKTGLHFLSRLSVVKISMLKRHLPPSSVILFLGGSTITVTSIPGSAFAGITWQFNFVTSLKLNYFPSAFWFLIHGRIHMEHFKISGRKIMP